MSTYFLNYREPGLYREDTEGEEQPDLHGAVESAVLGARELIADRIRRAGEWTEGARFEITDTTGAVLAVLPFEQAIVKIDRR